MFDCEDAQTVYNTSDSIIPQGIMIQAVSEVGYDKPIFFKCGQIGSSTHLVAL